MTTPPPEVEVQCLARQCRRPTIHILKASLSGGRALYGCTAGCQSAIREISEPHTKTPGTRAAAAHTMAVLQEKWKREQQLSLSKEVRPFKTLAAYKAATETKPDQETKTMKDKLITLIRKTVAEQIGEQQKQLTEDHVRGIIREELEKLLEDDKPTEKPEPPDEVEACRHKNFMRKCPGCQARKAAEA
jgi:hypothetical protein